MTAPLRLTVFAAGLAALFVAALAMGGAVGPQRGGAAVAAEGAHGMRAGETMPAQPVRGLAVSSDGLTLQLARTSARPGTQTPLSFRVVGRDGRTVRDFDVEHTKRMHLIVVRRDLTGFQHLHPAQRRDGSWAVPVTLRDAGTYRVFADFSVHGRPETLADDLQVDGLVRSLPLPTPVRATTVDGMTVKLTESRSHADRESELGLTVTRNGRSVRVEDYLGAKGHLVALREGDLAFLHVHPDENRLRFMATFPTTGRYRLFLQFRTGGHVHTAAFTHEVSR